METEKISSTNWVIEFLIQSMWNQVPASWIDAIHSRFFATWLDLTASLVRKQNKNKVEKSKGHVKTERKMLNTQQNKNCIKWWLESMKKK